MLHYIRGACHESVLLREVVLGVVLCVVRTNFDVVVLWCAGNTYLLLNTFKYIVFSLSD